MKTYQILLSFTLLALFGCATATGPIFSRSAKNEQQGTVYIYRLNYGGNQSWYSPKIFVNEREIMELPRDAYTFFHIDEGKHTILFKHNPLAGYKPASVELDVKKGEEYYVRIADPFQSGSAPLGVEFTYISSIQEVPLGDAIAEIKNTRFTPNSFEQNL